MEQINLKYLNLKEDTYLKNNIWMAIYKGYWKNATVKIKIKIL
jgi:hypothetical protein